MKYEASREYSRVYSVMKMCKALNLDEGAYYQWLRRKEAKDQKKEKEKILIEHIREVFEKARSVYGYRRMQHTMEQKDFVLTEYKMRRIMRENGLYPVKKVKIKPARKGKRTGSYLDNVINQNFKSKELNEIWVGDITYIKTCLGWVYLNLTSQMIR